jgi:DNA (cytosine-5)-methyltransferase 1
VALERTGWRVAWSNQWEPSTKKQHASECYERHFSKGVHVCEDITLVLDSLEDGPNAFDVPDVDLVVGGFPCQDYSVAKTANQAHGISGKKGVLWWQIHRLLDLKRPRYFLLENVDRLLNSPASQRGRDFAIMLASVSDLGYAVEWRVVNAAKYGFPQKRRRVFIVGVLGGMSDLEQPDALDWLTQEGIVARALPAAPHGEQTSMSIPIELDGGLPDITERFGRGLPVTPFRNAGLMVDRRVWTTSVTSTYEGPFVTLRDVLEPESEVPDEYFISDEALEQWKYLKGAKKEERHHRATGTPYFYTEGAIPYPDNLDDAARTILTGEGGGTPSRFKHIIPTSDGRMRRLTPRELERIDGFPDDWTAGMPDAKRAFCMGNALVVGVVEKLASSLAHYASEHLAVTAKA